MNYEDYRSFRQVVVNSRPSIDEGIPWGKEERVMKSRLFNEMFYYLGKKPKRFVESKIKPQSVYKMTIHTFMC